MTISTTVEIPEGLHDAVQAYIEARPNWDHDRVIQAALSLFLMQNGVNQPQVNSLYLESLFGYET